MGTRPSDALGEGITLAKFRRPLFVAAHPDDMEWYAGGLARLMTDRGAQVHVVVCSDGENGPNRTGAADLRSARREEQRRAGRINGYASITFLALPDRGFARHPDLDPSLQEAIDRIRPDVLLSFDSRLPALPYLHADHQGVGAAVERVAQRRTSLPVYVWQTRRPTASVDITKVIETKVEALRSHRSQGLGTRADMHRGWARRHGRLTNVPYAELYRRVR